MFNAHFRMTALLFAILAVSFLYLDLYKGLSMIWWWWDSYEHFLGGMLVGSAALWFGSLRPHHQIGLVKTALFVLFIGFLWEIMEVLFPMGESIWFSYQFDTLKDLVLDVLGGIVAWNIGTKRS